MEVYLTTEDGFRMNFTMPYWRQFDSNSEGRKTLAQEEKEDLIFLGYFIINL